MDTIKFSFGNNSYAVSLFTPLTAERVIRYLGKIDARTTEDIPKSAKLVAKAVASAITGSGFLSRIRTYILARKIIRQADTLELVWSIDQIIRMIPAQEFYEISDLVRQFSRLIATENE